MKGAPDNDNTQQQREEVGRLAEDAHFALKDRNYPEAAWLFEAASLVPVGDRMERWRYLMDAAYAWFVQGNNSNDNEALLKSIDNYKRALALVPRADQPLDWAETQNNLGAALYTLGRYEVSPARFEESVTAYRLALEVLSRLRHRMPLEWARTQMNLGLVFEELGWREGGAARLEEALAAFRNAYEVYAEEGDSNKKAILEAKIERAEAVGKSRQDA